MEELRLRSEKDKLRKEAAWDTFLESSDRDGLHLLRLPSTVCSCTEQQFAVMGIQGFDIVGTWRGKKGINGV